MKEFVDLRAKTYSRLKDDANTDKNQKEQRNV